MYRKALLMIAALLVGGGVYHQFFYPPTLMKKAVQRSLEQFGQAVATGDRAQVGQVLDAQMADDAIVHLEVSFLSLVHQNHQPMTQDFDKAGFVRFVDNILYSLETYHYQAQLESLLLNADRSMADITFTSKEWADGKSHYGGVAVGMRFSSDTQCSGQVVFAGLLPKLKTARCAMSMRSVPKPEEAYKIQQNPEAMRQFLTR
jgi:hypothetical protein